MMEVSRPPEYARTTFSRMCTPRREAVNTAFQQQNKNGFLNMQAVLRLVEHNRTWRIDHRRRHLISAMRRQAMHKDRMLGGSRKQLLIHLERHKDSAALGRLFFLAHARPDIGVHGIGPRN